MLYCSRIDCDFTYVQIKLPISVKHWRFKGLNRSTPLKSSLPQNVFFLNIKTPLYCFSIKYFNWF